MGYWQKFLEIFGFNDKKEVQQQESFEKNYQKLLDSVSGTLENSIYSSNSSNEENNYDYFDGKKFSKPNFDIEWFKILQYLGIFNADISLAISNIVNLASQDFEITFENASILNEKKMISFISKVQNEWYPYSSGINSLVNDLFRQLSVNGCLSAEIVLAKDLKTIEKIVKINPFYVRFEKDEDNNYKAHQYQPMNILTNNNGQMYKELSNLTFKYISLQRDTENPYPIPPLISALKNLGVQDNVLKNIAKITEKSGAFGFMAVNLKKPIQFPGENDKAYFARTNEYLRKEGEKTKRLSSDGIVVGYEGTHEVKLMGSPLHANNAQDLMKMIDTILMAGIKQDPALMGREKNTSEAFGRVLLSIMTQQITTYQEVLASYLEYVFTLALRLEGFKFDFLKVKFREPMIEDELVKNQSESAKQDVNTKKIDNLLKLQAAGVISVEQVASELGYSQTKNSVTKNTNVIINNTIKSEKKNIYDFENMPVEYDEANILPSQYAIKISSIYSTFIEKISNLLEKSFEKESKKMTLSEVQNKIYLFVRLNFNDLFVNKCKKIIETQTKNIYLKARKDKSIFLINSNNYSSFNNNIPDAVFHLLDYQTIEFLTKIDTFYLGEMVVDERFKERLFNYIRNNYIESDIPIGKNKESIDKIKNAFSELMLAESYKIRRIIDTSVNRMRNFGNINYMSQAKIEKYKILEVMDKITCAYCSHLNNKEFTLKNTREKIEKLVESNPSDMPDLFPFATIMPIDDFKKLTTEQLENSKISLPPFHPHCRGRVVAIF